MYKTETNGLGEDKLGVTEGQRGRDILENGIKRYIKQMSNSKIYCGGNSVSCHNLNGI